MSNEERTTHLRGLLSNLVRSRRRRRRLGLLALEQASDPGRQPPSGLRRRGLVGRGGGSLGRNGRRLSGGGNVLDGSGDGGGVLGGGGNDGPAVAKAEGRAISFTSQPNREKE